MASVDTPAALTIGVIGSNATFAGQAAAAMRLHVPVIGEARYFSSGKAMTDALVTGEVDLMVGAMATIAGGDTPLVARVAAAGAPFHIVHEQEIAFRACILGTAGASLDEIEQVFGGPASLPLAKAFVAERMPGAKLVEHSDSGATIGRILGGDRTAAMLGTRLMAERGMEILATDIEGEAVSGLWWLVAARPMPTDRPTTIFLRARCGDDGRLAALLSAAASCGFLPATIASAPTGAALLEADFLVRCHGNGSLDRVRHALAALPHDTLAGAINRESVATILTNAPTTGS